MQVLQIDLLKNPEVKDLVTDLQPGDAIKLHCSIKALDDQTLTLTLDEAEEGDAVEEDEGDEDEEITDEVVVSNVKPGRAANSGGNGGMIASMMES